MTVMFIVIALITLALLLTVGKRDGVSDAVPDLRPEIDPQHPRFDVVFRGYRMDEVDAVIDALRAENAHLKGKQVS
ncbi:MAG: DivIVA domain-containing protein [Candidatus Nanopelagicales bacterium]|nr:DivIVA domain-containing protein [Candidatus Nanopelagicales bacterium]